MLNAEAVLVLDKDNINEAELVGPGDLGNIIDPTLYMGSSFGAWIASRLSQMGRNYSAQVSDFGQFIAVTATGHNLIQGKSVTKTYVIAFNNPKRKDGRVYVTSKKWRTISDPDQAASYIAQSIRAYAGV